MPTLTDEFIEQAVHEYQSLQESRIVEPSPFFEEVKLRHAAVMIPLLIHKGDWHVLLTHRSQNLVEHRGQVAFPGGAQDRHDRDLQETALREMYEEIGISPHDVNVYGSLGDMRVVSGYVVRLFVGKIPWPYDLKINPSEVESAFTVPLKWLSDPNHRSVQYRSYAGHEFPVIFFDEYEGHILWGASAEMTLSLLTALKLVN